MQNFDFQNPTKIVFGKDTVRRVGKVLDCDRHRLVMLIAGGGSIKQNGVYEAVSESLRESGIRVLECWGVQPNPTLAKTREMIAEAKRAGIDAISKRFLPHMTTS